MKSATTKFLRKLGAGANYAKAGDSSFVYGASPIDIVCHIASFFEAVAFMQTDIFRLRVIEAVAMAMVAVYALLHTNNVLDCHFLWASFHVCIHCYNIYHILAEYFSLKLTEDDEILWKGKPDRDESEEPPIFSIFSRAEFAVIKHHYEWKTFKRGERIFEQGIAPKHLLYITEGKGAVWIKGVEVSEVDNLQWLGEMSFFTNEKASATIVVKSETMKVIQFDMHYLRHQLHNHGHSIETSAFSKLPSLFCKQIVHRTQELSDEIIRSKSEVKRDYTRRKIKNSAQVIPENGNADDGDDSKRKEKSGEAMSAADDFRFPGQ